MNLIRKSITLFGTIALLALVLVAFAPRAARGVAAALVQVANTSANPVPVTEAFPPQPFQQECFGFTASISSNAACSIPVPAGKRLVVQYVALSTVTFPGQRVVTASILPASDGTFVTFPVSIPFTASESGADISVMTQEVRLYANQDVTCAINLSFAQGGAELTCSLSGYLVDAP